MLLGIQFSHSINRLQSLSAVVRVSASNNLYRVSFEMKVRQDTSQIGHVRKQMSNLENLTTSQARLSFEIRASATKVECKDVSGRSFVKIFLCQEGGNRL